MPTPDQLAVYRCPNELQHILAIEERDTDRRFSALR